MITSEVFWLVVSTHMKNISQNGNLPQIGVKKKHSWNHHLVLYVKLEFIFKQLLSWKHVLEIQNKPYLICGFQLVFVLPKPASLIVVLVMNHHQEQNHHHHHHHHHHHQKMSPSSKSCHDHHPHHKLQLPVPLSCSPKNSSMATAMDCCTPWHRRSAPSLVNDSSLRNVQHSSRSLFLGGCSLGYFVDVKSRHQNHPHTVRSRQFPSRSWGFRNPAVTTWDRNTHNIHIPSLKLTWHLKRTPWKRRFLWKPSFFGAMLVLGSILWLVVESLNWKNICTSQMRAFPPCLKVKKHIIIIIVETTT